MMHLMFKVGDQMTPYANKRAIRVMRRQADGRSEEFKVDADKILAEGDFNADFVLENGDRVIIPSRKMTLF